jgi:hypothetical protein
MGEQRMNVALDHPGELGVTGIGGQRSTRHAEP